MDTQGWVQKWITDGSNHEWARIIFGGKTHTVCAVGIKSADDCPGRDPTKFKVSYKDEDEDKEVEIAEHALNFEHQRHRELKFKVPACETTAMKFDFFHDNHDHFQLCQIKFYTAEDLIEADN